MRIIALLVFLCACGQGPLTTEGSYVIIGNGNNDIPVAADYTDDVQATASNCLPKTLQVVAGSVNYSSFRGNVRLLIKGTAGGKLCTAGFIRDNRLITAAHCLKGATEVIIELEYANVYAESWEIHPDDAGENQSVASTATDVGIISLSNETVIWYKQAASDVNATPPAIGVVGTQRVQPGECFAWAGYGKHLLDDGVGTDGVRRVGANLVRSGISYKTGYYASYSQISPAKVINDHTAMFGSGDSGAPIYNVKGEVVGVVSATYTMGSLVFASIFADVTNEKMRSFITKE
jgi:V8-like Glu-specific endopeptidase